MHSSASGGAGPWTKPGLERWHELYDDGLPPEIDTGRWGPLSLFRERLRRDPEAHRVRYFDTPLRFARCDALSDALAAGLSAHGVARGERVALHLQNDPQFVLALLAVWKLGPIAVMCSPMLPGRELAAEFQDSGAIVLITLRSLY